LSNPEHVLPTFQSCLALAAAVFDMFLHRPRCSGRRQIPHKVSPQLITEMLRLYPPLGERTRACLWSLRPVFVSSWNKDKQQLKKYRVGKKYFRVRLCRSG
jgi:hypothetical protein